jgi:hypothetical protein
MVYHKSCNLIGYATRGLLVIDHGCEKRRFESRSCPKQIVLFYHSFYKIQPWSLYLCIAKYSTLWTGCLRKDQRVSLHLLLLCLNLYIYIYIYLGNNPLLAIGISTDRHEVTCVGTFGSLPSHFIPAPPLHLPNCQQPKTIIRSPFPESMRYLTTLYLHVFVKGSRTHRQRRHTKPRLYFSCGSNQTATRLVHRLSVLQKKLILNSVTRKSNGQQ